MTSVKQFNAISDTQKCRVLRSNSLSMVAFSSNYFFEQTHSFCLQKTTLSDLLSRVDILIRYIEVDFTFGLPDYVRYIEEFVISRFYSIHFNCNFGRDIEYRSLYRGLR